MIFKVDYFSGKRSLVTIVSSCLLILIFSCSLGGAPSYVWHSEIQGTVEGFTFSGTFYSVADDGYRLETLGGALDEGSYILWDFGDGAVYAQTERGELVKHVYESPGDYVIYAVKKDANDRDEYWENGDRQSDEFPITVPSQSD